MCSVSLHVKCFIVSTPWSYGRRPWVKKRESHQHHAVSLAKAPSRPWASIRSLSTHGRLDARPKQNKSSTVAHSHSQQLRNKSSIFKGTVKKNQSSGPSVPQRHGGQDSKTLEGNKNVPSTDWVLHSCKSLNSAKKKEAWTGMLCSRSPRVDLVGYAGCIFQDYTELVHEFCSRLRGEDEAGRRVNWQDRWWGKNHWRDGSETCPRLVAHFTHTHPFMYRGRTSTQRYARNAAWTEM